MQEGKYSYGEDFQRKILALMVRDPKFVEFYEDILRPTYFSYDILGTLCRLFLDYWNKYKAIPSSVAAQTVVTEHVDKHGIDSQLAGEFWTIVSDLYSMDLEDGEFVKDKVVQFGRQMAMRQALIKAATIAQEWGDLDQVDQLLRDALATGQGIGDYGLNLYQILPDIPAMYQSAIVSRKVRTGWPTLDHLTGGGLGGGELGFVCGGTGQGKSSILVNFAAAALDTMTPVIYLTHELSELAVASRITARITGLPEMEVRQGGPRYAETVANLIKHRRHLRIKYMNPGTTPGAIRSYISRVSQMDSIHPGLIIDDYADELTRSDRKSYGNRYEDMGIITSELIVIAKDFKCPLWTASQFNRTGFFKEDAGAEAVSDSFQKIMKADVVLVLNQTREQKAQGVGVCRIDKNRSAPDQRSFLLRMEYQRMLIVEQQSAQ